MNYSVSLLFMTLQLAEEVLNYSLKGSAKNNRSKDNSPKMKKKENKLKSSKLRK